MNTRSNRSAIVVLVTMTAVSAGLTGAGQPAPQTETEPTGVSAATLQRQHILDGLAYKVTNNLPESERHRIHGYAGMVVNPEVGSLTVYWKGKVPARVKGVAARTPQGIFVVTKPATYSAAEMVDARQKIASATDYGRRPIDGTHTWNTLSVAPDGSGLELEYTVDPGRAASATSVATTTVAAAASKLTDGVKVTATPALQPRTASRQDDWAPWWGGAALATPTGGFCSTGFSVWRNGDPAMLTAAHCGTSDVFKDRTGEWIGDVAASNTERDITVMRVFNGSVGPNYYDGEWDTNGGKHIVRANINNNGDYVCTSGAMSGVHCNVQVYNDNTWYRPVDLGYVIKPVIRAKRTNSDIAMATGDSGGPVVTSPDGTYGDDMEARGIISGGADRAVCDPNGVAKPGETTCFAEVIYVPIVPTLAQFGLAIAV